MSAMTPPAFDSATVPGAHAGVAVHELQDRLRSMQRHLISHRIGVGLCWAFVFAAIGIAVSAAADFFLELSTTYRAAWIAAVALMIVAGIAMAWRRGYLTCTLSETAVEAEGRLIQFGQRLRTTLDYQRGSPTPTVASESLLRSLRVETFRIAEQTEWGTAVDPRPLVKAILLAGAAVLVWSASLILIPEFRIAAARAILLPFEYTTVSYTPQAVTIKPGETVTVTAIVSGRSIASALLRYRPNASQADWVTVEFEPTEVSEDLQTDDTSAKQFHGELSIQLSDLGQDTEFEVLAGPRPLPAGSIRVLQPLTLERFEAHVVPPSYTGRPDETASTFEFRVLEGADAELLLEFNRPPADVRLTRRDQMLGSTAAKEKGASTNDFASAEIPLLLQDNVVRGTLSDLRRNSSYLLSAQTADGMSLESQQITIRVQPDLIPQVQFLEPPEELVVTATTEVPMVVEAGDDLGLHKVGVLFQIGSGPMQTLIEQSGDRTTELFQLSALMMLEEHQLTIQDAVTYYAYAEDNYFGQPRRTTTPLRFIDIRPYKLEFQVDESEGGSSDGSSVALEELIARQRQVLSQSFQSTQPSQPTVSDEKINSLIESQDEVRAATYEFAAGMAERGAEIPSLGEATTKMTSAIEALESGELTNAVAAEQMALAALIRARENLRKLLNQSSSQSSSAQRQFDRQQRQKLRMPKKKQSDQQEQLAQTRQKLEDLAKREREWSQQAKQCSGSSEGSSGQTSETPTPGEVAATQEKLQAELAEIQQQLEKLNAVGQAAREQSREAADSMAQGLKELQEGDSDSAAKEGERAAGQLEELSAHLAAMNARDFGQRLDEAQKVAQQLASQQNELEQRLREQTESGDRSKSASATSASEQKSEGASDGKSGEPDSSRGDARSNTSGDGTGDRKPSPEDAQGLARDQQAMASQAEMLAELLDALAQDAAEAAGGVQQKLQQAQSENSPREIADMMRHTADQLRAQRFESAARGSSQSLQRLQELSQSLGAARGEYAQPQLKELMALEEQLARLQQQMKRAQGKGEEVSAVVRQKWQQLESRLDNVAAGDVRLAQAMRELRDGPEEFFGSLALGDYAGLREVSKALQSKIQEAILAGALMDADQPVPPAYRELVEKYYRALSDDLR